MKHLFRWISNNTFSELINSVNDITPIALIIGVVSILILLIWDRPRIKKIKFFKNLPGPLVVVVVGILINVFYFRSRNPLFIKAQPAGKSCHSNRFRSLSEFFYVSQMGISEQRDVWTAGLTIALIASIETLLGIEAVDKLDPLKRRTPANQELKAQGDWKYGFRIIGRFASYFRYRQGFCQCGSRCKKQIFCYYARTSDSAECIVYSRVAE